MRRVAWLLAALIGSAPVGVSSAWAQQNFDFYVLALSWSPSFCAENPSRARNPGRSQNQCAPGASPGFVVHGLWPQFDRGYPENCGGEDFIPYPVWSRLGDIYPDKGLARHEWRTHGTCAGLPARDYFDQIRAARARVTLPAALIAPSTPQNLSPRAIERMVIDANRGLYPGMVAAICRRAVFTELRLCLSKDLRNFVACPEVMRQACREPEVSLPVGQ